jgi:pimeloyl-ACP methyl ester carboxylesterase
MPSVPPPNLDQWRRDGRYFQFDGKRVFVRIDGKGPALLLIHGFPTASWDWHKLWPALAQHYQLVAPDLLGLGFSAKPRGHQYHVAEQADLCLAALAEAGVTEAAVLAHDYGDTVAQELMARGNSLPVLLTRFVLLNGGLFPETHRPVLVQRLLASPVGPLLARLMSQRAFNANMRRIAGPNTRPSQAELDAFWSLVRHEGGTQALPSLLGYMAERRAQRARWVGALQQCKQPLTLINGLADPISGAHMVTRFRELVPQGKVVELPGIGHYPQIEAPDAVLAAALAALSE